MFRVFNCLVTEHDWRLVAVAVVVCLGTSLVAVRLLHQARFNVGRTRAMWIGTAGATTGFAIWATHFIGMLAYSPGIPIGYTLGLTFLSLLVAVAVTSIGFAPAVYFRRPWPALAAGPADGAGAA